MVTNFSKNMFINLMKSDKLQLPIKWDNRNFRETLKLLFDFYCNELIFIVPQSELKEIKRVCNLLLKTIDHYYNGLPSNAFNTFSTVMDLIMDKPIRIYQKSGEISSLFYNDTLDLFRIRNIYDNRKYSREEIFHTPFSLRSKINTCRYSIAGYPCLYLATQLALCCEETKRQSNNQITIASKFKIVREYYNNGYTDIKVIELGIKPIHFLFKNQQLDTKFDSRVYKHLSEIDLTDLTVMNNYLYWYPVIAASSFIRVNKVDPFASEYIIPQLLMQWVRLKVKKDKLYGIRYFSCASERASNLGFNYVFPAFCSNENNLYYCNILSKVFKLTVPVMLHNFESLDECQYNLEIDQELSII